MTDTTVHPSDFRIPDHLAPSYMEIDQQLNAQAWQWASELGDDGALTEWQAATVTVNLLLWEACEMAIFVARHMLCREPQRERWMEVCGVIYDRCHAHHAQVSAETEGKQ